jgi:large subunit ribosomal protein L18
MADKNIIKNQQADRRKSRVRKKVLGTAERPRFTVRKSLRNVFAQIIDDEKMTTLIGLSSDSKEMQSVISDKDNKSAAAKKVGLKLAEMAKAKGIELVVFDRNRFRYHGRIKAVADGAREGGLKF